MSISRIKSIDILRGLSMMWMFIGHCLGWWLRPEDFWLSQAVFAIMDVIGTSAFVFTSGMSVSLSVRKRQERASKSEDYDLSRTRNEYFFRAFLILILALVYNTGVALNISDLTWIWSWFVLFTVAFCLLIGWPLLKTTKMTRIIIGAGLWVANYFILILLYPHRRQFSPQGVLYHVLYNPIDLDPLFFFLTFFILGTVIGDVIHEIIQIDDDDERKMSFKKKLLIPSLISGPLLIILGILVQFPYQMELIRESQFIPPSFLMRGSLSWMIYTMGVLLLIISVFLYIEIHGIIKTEKSYKFLFYFSFYSLTIFLSHNLLYVLFYQKLNAFNIWFFIAGAVILWGLLFRKIYHSRWKDTLSIKVQLGKMSVRYARKIELKNSEDVKNN